MIKKRVDHGGKGWCTVVDDVQWWWPGLKERGIFDAIVVQEKGCLISFTLSYQCRCLLCLFHFPLSSVSLLSIFFLFTLSCWKNAVRFIAEKTFCLYFRFIFSLFFSLFSSRILTTSTVISQLIISRRVFIKFFNKNSILFLVFAIFSFSVEKINNNILSFFSIKKRKKIVARLLYIFISTIRKAFPSLFKSRKFEAKKYSRPPGDLLEVHLSFRILPAKFRSFIFP